MLSVVLIHESKALLTALGELSLSHLVFVHDSTDINVPIAGALNGFLVPLHVLHLTSDNSLVDMRRHFEALQPFHQLSIFCVDSFSFLLLDDKVERALLLDRL